MKKKKIFKGKKTEKAYEKISTLFYDKNNLNKVGTKGTHLNI